MGEGARFLTESAPPWWRRRFPTWWLLLVGLAGLAVGAAMAWPAKGTAAGRAAPTTIVEGAPTTEAAAAKAPTTGGTTQGDLSATTGFSTAVDGSGARRTSIGALVTNESASLAAYDVAVVFNLLDRTGRVIDSATETVAYLAPGGTAPVAPAFIGMDAALEPDALQVNLSATFSQDVGWAGVSFTAYDGIDLQVSDATVGAGPSGTELSFTATNPSDRATDRAAWSCVLRDGDRIVGGESSTVGAPIAAGGTTVVRAVTTVADLGAGEALCRAWA